LSLPLAILRNEIQVENKAIGINYIDTYIRSGLYPPPSLPSGLGTEAAGVVSKVGHGVTHIKAGDRVVYAQSALGAYSTVHNVLADKAAVAGRHLFRTGRRLVPERINGLVSAAQNLRN
jgi:NADPH:quinone reductase-like Zn-dependent oxidoreductase